VFTSIGDLCEDVNIVFGEDGISISSMDSSHVCLIAVKFASEYFQVYIIKATTAVGIKVSNLVRVLKCIEGESILFECCDDEFHVMSSNDKYRLKTIDLDTEEMDIPDMDVDVEINADSSILQKYIKNIASFGDTIEFKTIGEELSMRTNGEIGTAEMRVDQPIKIMGSLSASFASRYLVTFLRAANISKKIIVKISNEYPIVFEYNFAEKSFIKFYLAPKIIDED
jgi:proliferating cell nuclear antigen